MNDAIQQRLATLPTAPIASQAVEKGFACYTSSLARAIELSDLIGPEHLEIHTKDAEKVLIYNQDFFIGIYLYLYMFFIFSLTGG